MFVLPGAYLGSPSSLFAYLPSFVYLETGVVPGGSVDFTVDLFTALGSVLLMHPDPKVLEEDIKKIREMEENDGIIEYEPQFVSLK